MRELAALLVLGLLAACTSNVTVPSDPVLYEVPNAGMVSTSGGDPFATAPAGADPFATAPAGAPVAGSNTTLDDDRLNLLEYTLQQQKIDAAAAERELASARSQLVVVQPSAVPNRSDGVNVALYAQQTSNAVGQRIYRRGIGGIGACGRYGSPDDAQRAFLAAGGPETDRLGLDGDGDGFACKWDPTPYRQLKI